MQFIVGLVQLLNYLILLVFGPVFGVFIFLLHLYLEIFKNSIL